jgi:cohesin loading factor subunit SCC2
VALKLGLETAGILLFIVTSPGIDQQVINEEAIEASIVLLRHHLGKNILPALNNMGHIVAAMTNDDHNMASPSSAKKRRRSSAGAGGEQSVVRDMKKVYKHILGTVGLTLRLMERLETLVQKIPLDDQQIFNISAGALLSLELDPPTDASIKTAHQLHVATIGVVTSIYRKYPRHRSIIVEDLFPIMLRIPTAKKSLRTFPVECSSVLYPSGLLSLSRSLVAANNSSGPQYIQTMSAVIIAFVQSSVVRPTHDTVQPQSSSEDDNDNAMQVDQHLSSGLKGCQAISDLFVVHLLQRCARKGEEGGASEFRPILSNLIDDLLLLLLVPEYPAAEMLLLSIVNVVSRDLIQANSSTKALQAVESTYLNTAFDALGKICAAEARILASHREKPVKLKAITSKADDKRVNCYCQNNVFTESLMLDCDRCHTWYHGACVGLTRDTVPQEWHCDACQLGRIVEFERDKNTNMGEMGCSLAKMDESYCMRRLLIDYLSIVARNNGTVGVKDAYEFHLARWITQLDPAAGKKAAPGDEQPPTNQATESSPLVARLLEMWDPADSSVLASRGGSQSLNGMLNCLSDEGRSRIVVHLAVTQSSLLKRESFRSQVGLIVKLMGSETAASMRKLSVKAIEKVSRAPQ